MNNSLKLEPQAQSAPTRILVLDNLHRSNNNEDGTIGAEPTRRCLYRRPSGSFEEQNELNLVVNDIATPSPLLGSPQQILGNSDQ